MTRGFGTRAASRAMKSSGSKSTYEDFLNGVLSSQEKYGTKWTLAQLLAREIGPA